ncbi:hypothetical protein HPB47_000720 [Ixodes persulcatus]|uniref:Uncharacterized protein n=1 Tax=Ixodes persulcatus TaxID=34615 RepID=A0AC60PSX4_IXOPE|nr:hypothetical protein HPB47_000720 [Ixodes persulcatus]
MRSSKSSAVSGLTPDTRVGVYVHQRGGTARAPQQQQQVEQRPETGSGQRKWRREESARSPQRLIDMPAGMRVRCATAAARRRIPVRLHDGDTHHGLFFYPVAIPSRSARPRPTPATAKPTVRQSYAARRTNEPPPFDRLTSPSERESGRKRDRRLD